MEVEVTVSDWIEHDGGGMPIPGDTFVLLGWDDGDFETIENFTGRDEDRASYWTWGEPIARYRIVTP